MSIYIKNEGFSSTYIQKNGREKKEKIKWIAHSDGKRANVKLIIDTDGNKLEKNMDINPIDLVKYNQTKPFLSQLSNKFKNKKKMKTLKNIRSIKKRTHKDHSRRNNSLSKKKNMSYQTPSVKTKKIRYRIK